MISQATLDSKVTHPGSKTDKSRSNRTFIALIVLYGLLAGISVFLPQGPAVGLAQAGQLPAPIYIVALISIGMVIVLYGGLGSIGMLLARKLALPEIWDSAVTNRQRFLIPALVGVAVGIVIIVGDAIFAPINGMGHFPHPPFPTSLVAALSAAIGEETMFRLFFISFWTWLVSRIILRGRWQTAVYWVVSVFSAVSFGIAHLPSVMYLYGWTTMAQVPPFLVAELVLLNGFMGFLAAYYFKKFGLLAPMGIHLWADVVWHVIWSLL